MTMPWFLPMALGVGALVTKEAWHSWTDPAKLHPRKEMWLLIGVGWAPLLLWIISNLWPQN